MTRRIEWKKAKISDETYESVGVFDVNNDGRLDIVSGGYWYESPDWTKHKICDVLASGEYFDDFSTIPMDVNGDGYLDLITGGWWGGVLQWRENPKGKPVEWQTHLIAETGNIETTRAWDVDGDGNLEIVPNCPGKPISYWKPVLDSDGKGTGRFDRVEVSDTPQGHGLGFGDVLTDGTGCFVTSHGWYEPPADGKGLWTLHPEFELGTASVPIIVADVNDDGRNEIIVGQAHGYGLDYLAPSIDANGERIWTKHPIDPFFSQYHEMWWVDIDGDGKCELVTGNRFRAHCGNEAGETDMAGLWYFKWNGESFTKCVIDYGKAGDHSGTGIFMQIVDLSGNGKLDIVAAGKEGLFLLENLGPEQAGAH